MLWQQMYSFLQSFFNFKGAGWYLILIAIGLSIAFGAVWLLAHWIPLLKRPWLWPVMVTSVFLTLLAITFVQIPLQYYTNVALTHFWNLKTLNDWMLLGAIPLVLLSGLVQEGAKMVPMAAWWWRSGKAISPKLGQAIGAAAGAGFGIFESIWALGDNFASGWTVHYISQYGFLGIAPFWKGFLPLVFISRFQRWSAMAWQKVKAGSTTLSGRFYTRY